MTFMLFFEGGWGLVAGGLFYDYYRELSSSENASSSEFVSRESIVLGQPRLPLDNDIESRISGSELTINHLENVLRRQHALNFIFQWISCVALQ